MNHPPQPADLVEAAALVRRFPLRWSSACSGAEAEEILERGWFDDAVECARVLCSITDTLEIPGQAFGGQWPVLENRGWKVAPALPVPVGSEAVPGVDGEYHCDEKMVWRETAGAEEPFLSVDSTGPPPGDPFELLWFGDGERFTIVDATLIVEDLFSSLTVAAEPAVVERLLVRARRIAPEALEGITLADQPRQAEVEVRRPIAATAGESGREPLDLFSVRPDVLSIEQRGDEVVVETVQEGRAVFSVDSTPRGWQLLLIEGSCVFTGFSLEQRESMVSLRAMLGPSIDPLAPGMRGRLAFDLRADLVALD